MSNGRSQFPRGPVASATRFTHRPQPRRAFTLTEILIVIGLILLVVTLAIPAFNVITGGRSVDAAQNQIAAALARARQDAMALQEPRGIVLFTDPNSGRAVVAEVFYQRLREGFAQLELLPDRDELELPVGVGCQVLPHGNGTATPPYPTAGVIMFDGLGRVTTRQYFIRQNDVVSGQPTLLWTRLALPASGAPDVGQGGSPVFTQLGALLYDQSAYNDAADKATWLNDTATPVLLNRYNGALLPNK